MIDPDYKLPCDVKLPPNTVIGKGCAISTLMNALRIREDQDVPRFIDLPAAHNAAGAAFDGMVNRMIVCNICGNKRCPKAQDDRFKCTGSNDIDQVGKLEQPSQGGEK